MKTTKSAKSPLPENLQTTRTIVPEVYVPETLAAPHRFIAAVMERDRQSAALARQRGWPVQRGDNKLADRRLRILSALYEALERRGHNLEHPNDAISPVWCVINGEPINFEVFEYVRRVQIPLSAEERKNPLSIANQKMTKLGQMPTGQLVLQAQAKFRANKRRWVDSGGRLEDQLGTIILKFEEMAGRAAIRRVELAEWHREIELKIAQQNERRARQQKIAADWTRIRELAADWSEAQRLRRFIDAVAARLQPLPDPEGHGRQWLDWVRAEIEELDPMGAGAASTIGELLKGNGLDRWSDEEDEDTDEY